MVCRFLDSLSRFLTIPPLSRTLFPNSVQLRKLNAAAFPIIYNDNFYQDIVKCNDIRLSKFAVWKGTIVGAICTRLEDADDSDTGGAKKRSGNQRLYIMTLAVSAVYRGRGIGSKLLESVLEFCEQSRQARRRSSEEQEDDSTATAPICEIALHVQISNQDAIDFYTKRFNFVQGERVDNYYRRIDPPHCYLLYKRFDQEPRKNEDASAEIASSDAASADREDDDTKPPATRK
jgi:N-alpha-acetyltransferase 50